MSTVNLEVPEPSPKTAALGGVPPAPTRTLFLQFLDLSDCTRLMDAGLQIVAKNSPHLTNLYLRRCVNITGNLFLFKLRDIIEISVSNSRKWVKRAVYVNSMHICRPYFMPRL